jgi:hypothetical protein
MGCAARPCGTAGCWVVLGLLLGLLLGAQPRQGGWGERGGERGGGGRGPSSASLLQAPTWRHVLHLHRGVLWRVLHYKEILLLDAAHVGTWQAAG